MINKDVGITIKQPFYLKCIAIVAIDPQKPSESLFFTLTPRKIPSLLPKKFCDVRLKIL